jgi:hypothetical protein
MTDRLKNLIADMNKSVVCLALELPELVHADVSKRWHALKQYIETSPDTRECPMAPGEVCKMN